ncbi:hypothetical protein RRG08_054751 [Elysia crispata]|uniref:Uncharacterized protein n=1 Tax=Elysia crispata TaxID=231223 RepID=A0AAE1B1Q9_9GAST|nr:hypothetical protein RRG08_054751 [Elysia crispata]
MTLSSPAARPHKELGRGYREKRTVNRFCHGCDQRERNRNEGALYPSAGNPRLSTRFKTFNLYPKRLDGRPLPPQSAIYSIIKSRFGPDRSLNARLSQAGAQRQD